MKKFPRTPHLPGSTATSDDIFARLDAFNADTFVATEKMDGSNIMITNKGAFARNGQPSSADWFYPARDIYNQVGYQLDDNMILVGELLTWRKCIPYEDLAGEFMVFSIIDGDTVMSWDDVVSFAQLLKLPVVPTIASGAIEQVIPKAQAVVEASQGAMEGFVMRNRDAFLVDDYASNVAKFVGSWHTPVAGNVGRNGIRE